MLFLNIFEFGRLFTNIVAPPSFPSKRNFPVKIYIHGGYDSIVLRFELVLKDIAGFYSSGPPIHLKHKLNT